MLTFVVRQRRSALWLVSLGYLPFASSTALAQAAPSRTAPPTLRPDTPQTSTDIVLPEVQFGQAPTEAADLLVTAAAIKVDGSTPAFQPAIDEAIAGIAGKPAKVADFYAAAARIEAAYARAGRVLTRVTLPPQQLRDGGNVRMLIIDGFIESVDVQGVSGGARRAVRRRAAALVGVHGLTLAEIERRVLLAGEVPGISLRSTLVRGTEVGGVKLVLNGEWKPVSLTLSAENNLGAGYGNIGYSAQLSFNNLLGQGDLIYAQATNGRDFGSLFGNAPLRRIVGLGAVVPIGRNGLSFNPEVLRVDTNPLTPRGGLAIKGRFERVALRWQYPLIHSRNRSVELNGSLDFVSERSQAPDFRVTLTRDRLRIANFGAKWAERLGSRTGMASDIQFSQGLTGLGARTLADAIASGTPLSRFGERADFSKLTGRMRIDQQLRGGFALSGTLHAQASLRGALPSAAQFSLDGGEGLSGFTQGSLNVDSGGTVRGELARAINLGGKSPLAITPYGFGAYGAGRLDKPTALEARNRSGWSAGGGARLALAPAHAGFNGYGAVEVSRNHDSTAIRDATRVTFNLTFRV